MRCGELQRKGRTGRNPIQTHKLCCARAAGKAGRCNFHQFPFPTAALCSTFHMLPRALQPANKRNRGLEHEYPVKFPAINSTLFAVLWSQANSCTGTESVSLQQNHQVFSPHISPVHSLWKEGQAAKE